MKVIVAGASGFIGQNLVPFLEKEGNDTILLSLRNPNWQESVPSEYDVIVDLVGKAHEIGKKSPASEYYRINVDFNKQLFQIFLKSKAKLFIYISSVAAVNEESINGILKEDTIANPQTPYGKSKKEIEDWLMSQSLPTNKKLIIIRPAMVHGPGDKGNLNLLFNIVKKGFPYPLASFDNKRSFLSIGNFNWVIGKIINSDTIQSGIYNLVDDDPISTLSLITSMGKELNTKAKLWYVPKFFIKSIAVLGSIIPLFPLDKTRLTKMTGNYIISNEKLKIGLGIQSLPIKATEGLIETIHYLKNKI